MTKKKNEPKTPRELRNEDVEKFYTKTIGIEVKERRGGVFQRTPTPTDLPDHSVGFDVRENRKIRNRGEKL
jgi:hypothetical protein